MVGISFPGISQLFVAATQPPSLAAITPLSRARRRLPLHAVPGRHLEHRLRRAVADRAGRGVGPVRAGVERRRAPTPATQVCADNQELRLQNPDMLAEVEANPFYADALGDPIAPTTFVDRIDVPVFIAGAWQDEQTGGHFPAMLDEFTGSPHVYATLLNGLHTDSIGPAVFPRMVEFLDLYVAERVPSLAAAGVIAPLLAAIDLRHRPGDAAARPLRPA